MGFDSAELASEFERVMLDNPNADVRTADAQVVVTLIMARRRGGREPLAHR